MDTQNIHDESSMLDLLLKVSLPLRYPQPGWSGIMQMIWKGEYPGPSSVTFLPMIDLNPSDVSCIYSTMLFIRKQAKCYNFTPVLTFDQPLWWRGMSILHNEPEDSSLKQLVLRLGAFHMEMNFLGSIGHLMTGSGLQELLELIYADQAVTHMLSGKAVQRAFHGHCLVDNTLNAILSATAFDVTLPLNSETAIADIDLKEAGELYDKVLTGAISCEEVQTSNLLMKMSTKLTECKQPYSTNRTAKLWLQYMECIDILKKLIKAERTGNWKMHLQAVKDMLPNFAASGHHLYAKSAYRYLQTMFELLNTHPEVYASFISGLHVTRRSDRFWAGLSSDLMIEQVLMRSLKTSGGLTRGRGMSEMQRLTWLMSLAACADMSDAMQELTSVAYASSDQHKEMTKARKDKDARIQEK